MKRTPLQRGPGPQRRTELRRSYRNPIPAETRRAVFERAAGLCEIRVTCGGWGAEHLHHRRLRSQGGSHGAANLLACCFACHAHVHAHPEAARAQGWIIGRSTGGTP